MKRKFKFKRLLPIVALFCILLLFAMNKFTNSAAVIENDSKVDPNSSLVYYLNIYYDGKDKFGVESSDSQVINVTSGTINIEDTLPAGLIFAGFVQTGDGSIGAVSRDSGLACSGYVVDGVGGLNFDNSTGTVSFQIKNMQAGCKVTVGIKTVTPATVDDPLTPLIETRRDFYNTATGSEGSQSVTSNTVHVWMGTEGEVIHRVSYEYEGTVPDGAPVVPSAEDYAVNSQVTVNSPLSLEGYRFSGWITTDVSVSAGKFNMPDRDVVFKGSFVEKDKHRVKYQIDGDYPESYSLPIEREYHEDSVVRVDNLTAGTEIGGYRFLGWTTTDVVVDSATGEFTIPNHDVTFVGKFELIKYKVYYKAEGSVYPANNDALMPATLEYAPGTTVDVAPNLSDVTGYRFLGWSVTDSFQMPEEDVTIYGRWQRFNGYFAPTITEEVVNGTYFHTGQTVLFKITVRNNSAYPIKDVMVRGNSSIAEFYSVGLPYTVRSKDDVIIDELAANSSVDIYAKYVVKDTDRTRTSNEVEIVAALSDYDYFFDDSQEYKAIASFEIQGNIKVCKTVTGLNTGRKFDFHITGNKYDSWISLQNGQCKDIYVLPGSYKVFEMQSVDYSIKSITGAITTNGATFSISAGDIKQINYVNQYNSKNKFFHGFGEVINRIEAIIP